MSSIKFAVVTDTHLGYEEGDSILQNDSFDAFDEALDIAERENVDFILHAGDMFNSACPSPSSIVRTNKIILKHSFTIPNDETQTNPYRCTNSDGEVNLKYPIFVINGNHDQPSGANMTSPCEILSSCGLIYYFEKFIGDTKFILKPVLIERGDITVAIYGLTYINSEHFMSLLKNTINLSGNPILEFDNIPAEGDTKRYSILLIHQDRPARGNKNLEAPYSLSKICPWMNLIIWGHEHDNKTKIDNKYGFDIIQPGSTIITQYKKYDEPKRGIDIVELIDDQNVVKINDFKNFELETARSYIFDELDLSKVDCFKKYFDSKAKQEKIKEKINSLIEQNTNKQKLPIVRLCVISSPLIQFNDVSYKQASFEFSDKVANPNSMVYTSKRKDRASSTNNKSESTTEKEMNFSDKKELDIKSSPSSVEESLSQFFDKSPLELFTVDILNKSLSSYYYDEIDEETFYKNVKDKVGSIPDKLDGEIPEDRVGFTPEEAAKFINDNKKEIHNLLINESSSSNKGRKSKAVKNVSNDENDNDSSEDEARKEKKQGGRKSKDAKSANDDEKGNVNDNDSDDLPPPSLPPKPKKKARSKVSDS